jgi:phosphoglucosamine mutase
MSERAGRTRALRGAADDYLRELELRFRDLDLSGRRILLDCANGAAYRVGPEIFRRLGADIDVVADEPDGRNINAGVGSTHIDALAETMRSGDYEIAFAFDGDADRVLAVDRNGQCVDGDEIIAIAALHLHEKGDLPGPGVAVTVMTNFGFHSSMKAAGIEVATTPVGDRNVIVELMRRGWALGGEQSGHIIETRFVPSGDGVAAALLTLEALRGRDLTERDAMQKLPQVLLNVRVGDRDAVASSREVWDAVDRESQALAGKGRVLVRASGTEPLVRVMVEAPEKAQCEEIAGRLAATVERELA